MRLYADYLNREYLAIDCDYVFVNLWGGQVGRPLCYRAVYDLVVRLRHATGIDFRRIRSGIRMRHGCCAGARESRA